MYWRISAKHGCEGRCVEEEVEKEEEEEEEGVDGDAEQDDGIEEALAALSLAAPLFLPRVSSDASRDNAREERILKRSEDEERLCRSCLESKEKGGAALTEKKTQKSKANEPLRSRFPNFESSHLNRRGRQLLARRPAV